ncbi:hypothetical protein HPB48_002168 [Haemaphysalis longicornis]|uniref:Uncharacterized protein n=1 Tax=Haemaphysalis longicornis TaxID=44386 RepID=A0A9J6F7P3_HAELO|nr:hypothetical protein HPB48_002168 [Haemaphysalis longicornis]
MERPNPATPTSAIKVPSPGPPLAATGNTSDTPAPASAARFPGHRYTRYGRRVGPPWRLDLNQRSEAAGPTVSRMQLKLVAARPYGRLWQCIVFLGNTVEWWAPQDLDVSGIEFKAMTSGAHRVNTDFIYFKRKDCYGLSCFENMKVENEQERGARMKSIGVLAKSYSLLHLYKTFLQKQVRFFMAQNTQLFKELLEVSRSPEKLWTDEHMQRVGLDPHGDKLFLTELVERYGIDIVLITDNGCCPA